MAPSKSMILSAFFFNPQGDHRVAWRHPHAPGAEILDLAYYRRLCETAERAKLDVLFVADEVAIWDQLPSGIAHYANVRLEMFTLLSALAAVTSEIGLIGTASTTYNEPFHIARKFASLDFISHGRAAWNIVTSAMDEEALNFGRDRQLEHGTRYQRAHESVDVVKALWDSWEDGALLIDKQSGCFADPARVHHLDHQGAFFKVRGPLNIPRPPQGHPVLVQAGSSNDGKELAARHADIHFGIFRSLDEGLAYRADMNERLAKHGRAPSELKILPGLQPIVADSRDEAAEKAEALKDLLLDRVAVDLLSYWTRTDLSRYPIDGPLPDLPGEDGFASGHTKLGLIRDAARRGLTIRELGRKMANTGSVATVSGTASDVADRLEEWFVAGAADGYNLMFPLLPEGLDLFAARVVPELQRRGIFHTDYAPGTLRSRLGLPRPANRFAAGRAS
ncbi:LLM class flavin-dependent oxidoreductase [Geminicoccus flavidas]|uniref:LLM class flavin-dependent oxidoreductase n=1 Tax=Geminicoccus flavidas TaxID=2506407 RepID=UPI00190F0F45|nr:LLM class flavin-dependent oxidoreductase [Geminicoccus flavidas]